MFVTDKIIYIQMQKTGSSHIVSLLSRFFDGEQIGNHNAASPAQVESDVYCITSIRNPWDWYLSLWTFGVQGGGGLRDILTNRMYRRAFDLFLENPRNGYIALRHEMSKNTSLWRRVYDDEKNVGSFRQWLKLVHEPENARWLGEGYGNSPIAKWCGFMTYRYLSLCCTDTWKLYRSDCLPGFVDVERFEKESCYIDFTIRQEALEDDFIRAVEGVRPLTREEKDKILKARKINTSKRSLAVADYYDDASIDLVGRREKLLIDKFDYAPPA